MSEAHAILDDAQERAPVAVQLHIEGLKLRPVRPIQQQPVESASHLDMLWGAFSATGDVAYVEAVIEVAEWIPADFEAALIQGAAAWSLGSKAASHELVYRVCKQYVDDAIEPVGDDLRRIVEDASEQWTTNR